MPLSRLLLLLTLPLYVLDQVTKFWTIGSIPAALGRAGGEPPRGGQCLPPRARPQPGRGLRLRQRHGLGARRVSVSAGHRPHPVADFLKKGVFLHPWSRVAVALLLCGILGNLKTGWSRGSCLRNSRAAGFWQRLSEGYVVDFIAVKIPLYAKLVPSSGGWWPAFNVADSCICIAAVLLFIGGLLEERAAKRAARQTQD